MPRLLTLWLDLGAKTYSLLQSQPAPAHRTSASNFSGPTESAQALTSSQLAEFQISVDKSNREMLQLLQELPLYQFYSALSQLISRMCHPMDSVFNVLKEIISKIIAVYPHQSLWQCLSVYRSVLHPERASRCKAIIELSNFKNREVSRLCSDLYRLSDQLIGVCNRTGAGAAAAAGSGNSFSLKREFRGLVKLFEEKPTILIPFLSFMVPSFPTSLSDGEKPNVNYDPFSGQSVFIESFEDTVEILSSMQKPKKMNIIGSDGAKYSIMCKPKDDLRQDSRLMEVNALMNSLLRRDQESRKRNLYIRTYNAVPLNENCGIIEWVPNLKGLRPILLRLYKEIAKGMTPTELKKCCPKKTDTVEEKRRIFLDNFMPRHPAMLGLWFQRTFPDPSAWYLARSNYIRTTAVMSMIGFILGILSESKDNFFCNGKIAVATQDSI